jgi:hypothetical protein
MRVILTDEACLTNSERYHSYLRMRGMVLQVHRSFDSVVDLLSAVYEEIKYRPERGKPMVSDRTIAFCLDTGGYGDISGSSLDKHLEISLEIYDDHVFKDDIAEVISALNLKEDEYVLFDIYTFIPSRTKGRGKILEQQANAEAEKVKASRK